MLTEVELSSLYLQATPDWSEDCEVIEIKPLLRELILEATRAEMPGGEPGDRERLIFDLIAVELRAASRMGSPIPMPRDDRLSQFCRAVIDSPSVEVSLEAHAEANGLTTKTVSRLFQKELGLGFREWRQMVQVAHAIAHLAQGVPIKAVASSLGYTPSAFTVMFRRSTGLNPSSLRSGG